MGERPDFATLGAIVLAAGFSRRMGGESKLLKLFSGRPVLTYVIGAVENLGLRQIIVVAGDRTEEIGALLSPCMTLIRNEAAAEGMGRSIAAGAGTLDAGLRGVFIVLGDMPFVEPDDYSRLASAFAQRGDAAICVPVHDDKRGHPVLFGRSHFPALTRLGGDRGARAVLDDPAADLVEIGGCSAGILTDLDDAEAFARAERELAPKGNGPASSRA